MEEHETARLHEVRIPPKNENSQKKEFKKKEVLGHISDFIPDTIWLIVTVARSPRYLRERRSAYQDLVLDRATDNDAAPSNATADANGGNSGGGGGGGGDGGDDGDSDLADWRTEGSPYIGEHLTRTVEIVATGTTGE